MTNKKDILNHLVTVGQQVRALKDNEALRIVFTALKNGIHKDFEECDAKAETLGLHWMRLHAVLEMEQSISALIQQGENAKAEIAFDEKQEQLGKLQG